MTLISTIYLRLAYLVAFWTTCYVSIRNRQTYKMLKRQNINEGEVSELIQNDLERIWKQTFLLVWPLKVKWQASEDTPDKLVLLRSQSFNVLSVEAETSVSESINLT